MSANRTTAGIVPGRLSAAEYTAHFSDVHPPLDRHEARVEADRCYFCYDAPCQQACPTSIDIPLFIRQITTGDDIGAAETILSANIMGGMCARVCPTETLCEEACVREHAEGKPVKIGLLAAPRHGYAARRGQAALQARGLHRQARRCGRRRAGRPVLRPQARRASATT